MTYSRIVAYLAIFLTFLASGWKLYTVGQINTNAKWTAEKLAMSETARLRERAAQISNERIDRDYQTQKARAADRQRATDDRLRDFTAATATVSTSADTSAASGADDPYRDIANQCAIALVLLDGYAQSLASKATALQGYAAEVCVAK